ncbi:MAG: arginyltransferase [Halomonas sp.]|uniref:Aspartate/glutamate leucyltransferase n=1 Tax=Billgrantia tianxiuensis TaxID=2497861 RepID=A0A6I6SPU8_9GAMM|nr:arginyltransferase [Halomonas tianxiuensis]MCE8032486.1 arginyltransferase [Halomonas sp. MCCC 1A11057]MDX5432981.1 arginyltransferase [Halomonas sp.]QHC49557.1 arginyltransferase [Halomonas tianxiuensis]
MSSNTPRHPIRDLRFFLTVPHACSYLEGRDATTLFLDPQESHGQGIYDSLALLGFRRSGHHLYRPHCDSCNACVSVRIPVDDFQPSRSQRRVARRNADLRLIERPALFDNEHYALYERYIQARHADGDMYPPSREQYCTFLTLDEPYSCLLEFRLGEQLLAISAFDRLEHGLSAIYTFFDPDPEWDRRSLGTFAVLSLVELAFREGLPHVYLGYWIRECRKMAYKEAYRPLEVLEGRHWRRLLAVTSSV